MFSGTLKTREEIDAFIINHLAMRRVVNGEELREAVMALACTTALDAQCMIDKTVQEGKLIEVIYDKASSVYFHWTTKASMVP